MSETREIPDASTSSPAAGRRLVYWPKSIKRRIAFVGCYLAFLATLLGVGYGVYWKWQVNAIWDHYYSELQTSGVLSADIRPGDDWIDVVMLGASTIEQSWSDVEQLLLAGLKREFGERVRVFNLARISHTSRDSALKFSRIADKPFDLILIYDGFNDCRMNNCPREVFRDDYSHCGWYRGFERRRKAATFKLPPNMLNDLADAIGLSEPDQNNLQYGGDLKTSGPFHRNLEEIIVSAERQHSLVALQTFAFHIPEGYSDEKFRRGELGYVKQADSKACPLKMWGLPKHVTACVDDHNRVIRSLAQHHSASTVLVDQFGSMSPDARLFIDACHFSAAGSRRFVDNLLPVVVKRLREKRAMPQK